MKNPMKINRKKLPIKYALEVYQELPGYPSYQDLEYKLVSVLHDKDLTKPFTAENLWPHFKGCLGTIKDLREFLDTAFLNVDPIDIKTVNVKGKKINNSYLLTSHSWE